MPFRREQFGHRFIKGGELRVAEDGGLDVRDGDLELAVAGPVALLEERGAHAGEDLPVAIEVVNVSIRNAAAQMAVNVLQVLRLGAVDVARQVEVVVVFRVADLGQRDHARVTFVFELACKGVHNLVNVLSAQAVLVAVLDEALRRIDHEDALASGGVLFVQHDDARGNARAVEQVGGKPDDPFDVPPSHDVFADVGLRTTTEQHAVG